MIEPKKIEAALSKITDQKSFLQVLLAETLGWPVMEKAASVEDVSFEWSAEELRASGLDKHLVDSRIWQIQRFQDEQPWGIFIIEFKKEDAFAKSRGLTGPLRKILRGLVPKARRQSHLPAWQRENLLFICTHQYQHYRFAYFKAPKDSKNAPLTTFGWGPGIPSRTACEFNLPALEWPDGPTAWVEKWQTAFDKEKLSKVFFDEYKALFEILRKDLHKQTGDMLWAHDYALQLLNRIMFLCFIQRKKWIGEDIEFLKNFWQAYKTGGQSSDTFFEKWIKVLFFEAFNDRFHNGHTHFPPKIKESLAMAPYLNGGLFKENKLDDCHSFTVSDERFLQILTFFDRYNFTVSEDTPLDRDVAVDPEMIGTVYESLVNISEDEDRRGEAGIFYTPRIEIDLMCRLSLVDWLSNHLGDKYKKELYQWIFALEPALKITADETIKAQKLVKPLGELLEGVAVVDPACGSGSFLVGMLLILDDLRERLEKLAKQSRSAYDRRKEIIGASLYGVDVKDWACHVTELRLWLSLIIDADIPPAERHVRRQPLLPNFSFNIRCGDSLVQEIGGIDMAHRRGEQQLSHGIKLKLAELKKEKIKFYNNDKECKYSTPEELEGLEVQTFRQLLDDRIIGIDRKAKDLMRIQAQTTPARQGNFLTGEPEGPGKQLTLDMAKREADIAALMTEKERLEQARDGLRSRATVPFVWDISFAEIFSGDKEGFDIVIGNPPYVRQENITDPNQHKDRTEITAETKKAYKEKLARAIYKAYPDYFGYQSGYDTAKHPLNKKSDLYIYFYFKGLSLLNARGAFCFITSNSWLDVGYGAYLQEFLLKRCHVKRVFDNKAKRSFKSADVNTVIVLLGPPQEKKTSEEVSLSKTARFVMVHVPFEEIMYDEAMLDMESAQDRLRREAYRVFAIEQNRLFEDGCELPQEKQQEQTAGKKARTTGIGIKIAKYIGNKWGGKYLRAPDIYWTILEKGKGKLVRLGDIAEVRRGFTTGANEFFYLDEEKIQEWGIEKEFLKPVIVSPRECKSVIVDPKELKYRVFMCHKLKSELKNTVALEWIKWGEKQKYDKRPSCSGRERWYDFPEKKWAKVLWPMIHNDRQNVFWNHDSVAVDHNLFEIYGADNEILWGSLSWTAQLLFRELHGRANLGEGALKTEGIDIRTLYCLNSSDENIIRVIKDCRKKFSRRSIMNVSQESTNEDRLLLDNLFFDLIRLSRGERDAVYEAVISLVEARLQKAGSLSDKKIRKRLDAVHNTTGIWSDLPDSISDADEGE